MIPDVLKQLLKQSTPMPNTMSPTLAPTTPNALPVPSVATGTPSVPVDQALPTPTTPAGPTRPTARKRPAWMDLYANPMGYANPALADLFKRVGKNAPSASTGPTPKEMQPGGQPQAQAQAQTPVMNALPKFPAAIDSIARLRFLLGQ